MRKFRDTNTGEIITEEELRKEFEELKKETPEEYDYSFNQYLLNCTSKNGMLIETTNENKNIENEKENKTMKTYDEKVEAIKNIIACMGESDAVALHNEYCYETNDYDDEIIEMERFDEICEGMTPSDIARSIFYGDFNPNHEYFHFNGYGNFESTNYPTDWIYPGDIAREIVDREESFRNDEIQEEIDSWNEENDEENEEEN